MLATDDIRSFAWSMDAFRLKALWELPNDVGLLFPSQCLNWHLAREAALDACMSLQKICDTLPFLLDTYRYTYALLCYWEAFKEFILA